MSGNRTRNMLAGLVLLVLAATGYSAPHRVSLPTLIPSAPRPDAATLKNQYHVTVNNMSTLDMTKGKKAYMYSADGIVEIRTDLYDPTFLNAKKIELALWKGNEPFWTDYKTVAENKSTFVYRKKITLGKTHGIRLRITKRDGTRVTVAGYPREFVCGKTSQRYTPRTAPAAPNAVANINITKRGELIDFRGAYGAPIELRFVKSTAPNTVDYHFIHTGQKPPYPLLQAHSEYVLLGGRWLANSSYVRSSASSKKFRLQSTEEENRNTIKLCQFSVDFQAGDCYDVYLNSGGNWVRIARLTGPAAVPTIPTPPTRPGGWHGRMSSTEVARLNQVYVSAYNRALYLISRNRANTAEAKKAYQDYLVAKAAYETANTQYQAMQLRAITNPGSGRPSRPHRPGGTRGPSEADVQRLYQSYQVAHANAEALYSQGKGTTPAGRAAYAEYKRAKAEYEAAAAAYDAARTNSTTTTTTTQPPIVIAPVPQPTRPLPPTVTPPVINRVPSEAEVQNLYAEYKLAYDKVSALITAGKGNTPQAAVAYKDYEAKKVTYEAAAAAYKKAQAAKPATPAAPAAPTQDEVNKLYREYIAAYNKLTYMMKKGQGETPAAQAAYVAYKTSKDAYEAAVAARDKAASAGGAVSSQVELDRLHDELLNAHDKWNAVVQSGQGNSAAGRGAQEEYELKKAKYVKALAARQDAGVATTPKAVPAPPVFRNKPPVVKAPSADAKRAYQRYIAAYNKYASMRAKNQLGTPAGKAATKEYQEAKAAYQAATK